MLKDKDLHPFSAHKVINNTLYVPSPLSLVLISLTPKPLLYKQFKPEYMREWLHYSDA